MKYNYIISISEWHDLITKLYLLPVGAIFCKLNLETMKDIEIILEKNGFDCSILSIGYFLHD